MFIETNNLFNNEIIFDFSNRKKLIIKEEINKISDDDLLLPNQEEMLLWLVDKFTIQPLTLNVDEIEKTTKQVKKEVFDTFLRETYYVDGLQVFWKIPYEGAKELFYVQPSTHTMNAFQANLTDSYLTISATSPLDKLQQNPTAIEKELQTILDRFQREIGYINNDIRGYNQCLTKIITDIIEDRRKKANIIKIALEAMNIPLHRNLDAPSLIPLKRKLVKPAMPTAKREKSYCILDEDYLHILGVLRHVGATLERARKTFSKLDEEELRDVILANLNGHYLGTATGETFRNNGKTDINIEFENRAAFVGECKIWKGEKIFKDTINQLLSYTTWRDSKNAIIFFNKQNKEQLKIQNKIDELIPTLDNYIKSEPTKAGEWEFIVGDTEETKTIHIFLFDIYEKTEVKNV